jgi:hypothetical protein
VPTAAAVSAAGAAEIPSGAPLSTAVRMTFANAQTLLGELNNALAGTGGRCDVAMDMYAAITSAPTYDVSQQSTDVQTAYGLYRQGIDLVNSTAEKVRRICNMGGGRIDKLDILVPQKSVGEAIGPLGRALDYLPATAPYTPSAPKPTATPVQQNIALSDLLLKTLERMQGVGGILDGAQTKLEAGFCGDFGPRYQTIITPVGLDENGRAPTWIDSYGAYKVAIGYFQNKLYRAVEVCAAGGGAISQSDFSDMRRAVDVAAVAVARAYDQLKHADLLGQ